MPKITKSQPFVCHGRYEDINALVADVAMLNESEWEKFTHRQKTIVGHGDTRTIPLLFDPVRLKNHVRHKHYGAFEHHLGAISASLSATVRRANLVKLLPESEISPHYDKGDFLGSTRRIHVPITTNEYCTFVVGGEEKHLPVGEMWEINNTGMEHSVHNRGKTARIHLVVDVR